MLNVGLYYKVKKGHEADFEQKFNGVVKMLENGDNGFL